jgi:hypothetical protein
MPITTEIAKLIIASYESGLADFLPDADPRMLDLDKPLEENERRLRQLLQDDIQSKIDSFGNGHGCFVKASSRSAKDTMVKLGVIQSEYGKLLAQGSSSPSDNERMGLFFTAGYHSMRQYDARMVIRSFCISQRVVEDLKLALRIDDMKHQAFIFREWTDGSIEGEYRMFIAPDSNTTPPSVKLTAISQYIQMYYSERVCKVQEEIRQFLIKYQQETIHPLLQAHYPKGYVLDVSVLNLHSPPSEWTAYVIEVNPFLHTAGRCLFEDVDGQKIVHGDVGGLDYPVLRVTDRVVGPNGLDKPWQRAMQAAESGFMETLGAS